MFRRPYRKLPPGVTFKGVNLIGTAAQLSEGCTAPTGGGPNFYGMNILPAWYHFLTTEQGGWYWQIDLAKSAGCNVVRAMSDGGGSCWMRVWDPNGTYASNQALYLESVRKVARYCQYKGMYFYPTLNCCTYNGATGNSDIASFAADFAREMAAFPNVIGLDVAQEFDLMRWLGCETYNNGGNQATCVNGATTISRAASEARVQAIIAACRVSAPDLALTASFNENATTGSTMFSATSVGNMASYFDYLDFHAYYDVATNDSQAIYNQAGTSGKVILVGEFGRQAGADWSFQVARWNAVWNNVVSASYSGQPGCTGAIWWACQPQNTEGGGDDWGAWTANGTPRTVVTTMAAQTVAAPVLRFPERRRRVA